MEVYRFITPVVFLMVASLISADVTNFADVDCGIRESVRSWRQSRIVGGENATQGEFPWLVSLTRSGGHFCGGTIVNKDWVLTAAHCLCSGTDVLGTSTLRVTLAEHDLRLGGDVEVPVAQIILHPQFHCAQFGNDIALLKLGTAMPWSLSVLPACFPKPIWNPPVESEAVVTGWGWTAEKGIRSNILQKVKVSVIDNDKCQDWYVSQGKKLRLENTQMCAGFEKGGKDACWADSGGPLMMGERSRSSLTVVGVVSTGIGCARHRMPGVYTRISQFVEWISLSIAVNK